MNAEKTCIVQSIACVQSGYGRDLSSAKRTRDPATKRAEQAEEQQQILRQTFTALKRDGASAMGKANTALGVAWQFDEGHDEWALCAIDANEQMQNAYKAYLCGGQNVFEVTSCGASRIIDFKDMTQTNQATGKIRKIRLLLDVPRVWVTPKEKLVQQDADIMMRCHARPPL